MQCTLAVSGMQMHRCTHKPVDVQICAHARAHTEHAPEHMQTHTQAHRTCSHTHTHALIQHACTHTHTHTHSYSTHMHTHTHSHTAHAHIISLPNTYAPCCPTIVIVSKHLSTLLNTCQSVSPTPSSTYCGKCGLLIKQAFTACLSV